MATYTPPSGNYGAMDRINKDLPKDQQKLADAVKGRDNRGTTEKLMDELVPDFALSAMGGRTLMELAPNSPKLTKIGKYAGGGSYAPHLMSFGLGYEVGEQLDKRYDYSGKIANTLGPMYARLKGVDTNTGAISPEERAAIASGRNPALEQKGNIVEQPMTPAELQAIREGKNPLKPIYDTNSLASPATVPSLSTVAIPNVIGYEEMAGKSQQEREAIASKDLGATFEGMYKTKDGQMMGQLAAPNAQSSGMNQIMSPQEVAAFENNQVLNEQPRVSGTPEEGLREFTDARGNVAYGNESAIKQFSAPATPATLATPAAPRMTAGQQAQANFERARDSGKEFTPEQVVQAQELAASAGRTFDEDTGYSKDFDPVIQEAYLGRQRELKPTEAPEATNRIQPTEGTQPQSDYEKQVQEDEKGIVDRAREQGRSQEYIDKMLEAVRERRNDAEEEQSYEDLKRQLEIKKLNKELSEEEEQVDIGKVNSTYKMMKDQGVNVDPNTGAITVTEKGIIRSSEKPLAANSALFQQLSLTREGRYILNTRPPEISKVENPSTDLAYPANDGRIFRWDGSKWSVVTEL